MSCKRLLVRKLFLQSSLVVHWLGFWTFTAEGPGSILSWGIMIWKATKEEKENYFSPTKDFALGCLMPKGLPISIRGWAHVPQSVYLCVSGYGCPGRGTPGDWEVEGRHRAACDDGQARRARHAFVLLLLCARLVVLSAAPAHRNRRGHAPSEYTIRSLSWFRRRPPLQDNWVFLKAPAGALSQIQLDRLSGCFPLSCNSQAREIVLPSPYTLEGLFSWPSPECTHPWCFFFPTRDVSLGENNWQRK